MAQGSVGVQVHVQWSGNQLMSTVNSTMAKRVKKVGAFLERDIKKSLKTSAKKVKRGSGADQVPFSRDGMLRRSITHATIPVAHPISVWVGTTSKVGLLLEIGGSKGYVIRPRNARALLVEIDANDKVESRRTNTGGWKIKIRGSLNWYKWIRRKGKSYILVNRVFREPLKKRPFLVPALKRNKQEIINIMVGEEIGEGGVHLGDISDAGLSSDI
jgi:hypothetical protein